MDHRSLASSLLFGLFVTLVGGNQDVHEYWEEGHDDYAGEDVLGWGFVDLSEDFDEPSHATTSEFHTSFRNIWFHAQQFYAVADISRHHTTATKMGNIAQVPFLAGQQLVPLPVANPGLALSNLLSIRFEGLSIALEHPYNGYSKDLSFWAEALIVLLNSVSHPSIRDTTKFGSISKVIVPNLSRNEVPPWALDVLRLAIGAAALPVAQGEQTDPSVPELLFLDDLNLINMTYWVLIDELITPLSRYNARSSGIASKFSTPEIAQRFRALAFGSVAGNATDMEGEEGKSERKFITLLTDAGSSQSVPTNVVDVMEALEAVATKAGFGARHIQISSRTSSAAEAIRVMARTKVLVGRTGAVLVNAMFLPPGSSLLELIPYNWAFMGLDAVYRNITLSVGDVGYSSWRAEHAHSCAYASPSDARFAGWDVSDCVTATCLEVHARAGIIVDIPAMEKRLSSLLLL